MRSFILLGLTASNVFAALSSNGEPMKRAGLAKRNLGVVSPNQLFGRQIYECPLASTTCSDGMSCCELAETCCLDGCCQNFYSCDPNGPDNTTGKPCVCYGFGCPDPQNDETGSSSTSTRSFRSSTSEATSATTAAAAAPTDSSEDSSVASTSSEADNAETSATETDSSTTVSESAAAGGSGGDSDGAGTQLSSMGAVAIMLLAGSVGVVAVAL